MERKFIDTILLDGWEIDSDSGFVPAKNLFKTEEYDIWIIRTTNCILECADDHILFDKDYNEIYAKDLSIGSYIQTRSGLDQVLAVYRTDRTENMYDIEVDTDEHRYYTNDVLSHNTTITTCFILWYVLFHPDKKVAVLANKGDSARDIVGRIETAYINLPKWIQSEVVSWNKGSFELGNGSAVIGAATSSDAVRGRSYSCVTGDTIVTVLDEYDNVYRIPISEVENIKKPLKVLTYNGFKSFDSVKITEGYSEVLLIKTYSGKELKCTFNHLLRISDGTYKRADELSVDSSLYGNESISSIRTIEHIGPVYDLVNVADGNHYLTNGITSHNCIFIDECLGGNTVITIRDKSNEISTSVTLKDFYNLLLEQNENKKYCSN